MKLALIYLILIVLPIANSSEEDCAKEFLKYANRKLSKAFDTCENMEFNFHTNLTNSNKIAFIESETTMAQLKREIRNKLVKFNTSNFESSDIQRQIQLLSNIGDSILPTDKLQVLSDTINNMVQLYSTTMISSYQDSTVFYTFNDLINIFPVSVNPGELKYLWISFINELGIKVLPYFHKYVHLKNEAAHLQGLRSATLSYEQMYEEPDLHRLIQNLLQHLKQFYEQIHAFLRFRLRQFYGELVPKSGCIPIHLVGDLEVDTFQWMVKNALPFENCSYTFPDYLRKFRKSRRELYQLADDFFVSINLPQLPPCVWKNSIFQRLRDEQSCYPNVYFPYKNYKFIDCTTPEDLSLFTYVFLGVSVVQSYLQIEHQPFPIRSKPYSTIYYAMGNLLELSARSKKFFTILSIDNKNLTAEDAYNKLFVQSMETVPDIFANYVLGEWRKNVFDGETTANNYNREWWKLMHLHLGLEPPMHRPSNMLDASMRFKLVSSKTVKDKIIARILSYQLHKELCLKTGEYVPDDTTKPLHECCLYGHKIVGDLLGEGLRAGRSKKWTYMLKVVTGQEKVSTDALLEYFEPLRKWLDETNKNNSEVVGWKDPRTIVTES